MEKEEALSLRRAREGVAENLLDVRVVEMLAVRKTANSGTDLIFHEIRGKTSQFRVSELSKMSRKIRKAIHGDPGLIPYAMRHTFASRANAQKAPRAAMKALLGHATIEMGDTYIHANREQMVEVIRNLEEARPASAS